jgi:hypothetical protein
MSLIPHVPRRKATWEHYRMTDVCKPRREALPISSDGTWILDFLLLNYKKVNFCCLRQPACGNYYGNLSRLVQYPTLPVYKQEN